MSRNCTETCNKCNLESAIAYDLGKTGVLQFCLFELLASRAAAVPEGTVARDMVNWSVLRHSQQCLLEIGDFADKGSSSYDRETDT
jgi:hypothetical protein